MLRVIVLALLAGGCIEAELVPCEFGRSCARGYVCDEIHKGCVTPGQIAACTGIADGTDCTSDAVLLGGCFDGICLVRGCGNGVIEVENGETCDDHNQISHDGCRDDCRSTEVCGNGVVDTDEECDDGNLMSRDGCDSRCLKETAVWSTIAVTPTRMLPLTGAYDEGRNRYVQVFDTETWEWDGTQWTASFVGVLGVQAVVYDPDRGRVVAIAQTDQSELASWDGTSWTRISANASCCAQVRAVAFDKPRHQLLVMFSVQTWTIDTTGAWKQQADHMTLSTPSVAAYDPDNGDVVLVAPGAQSSWDGMVWATPKALPFATVGAMTFDPDIGHLVLVEADSAQGLQAVYERSGGNFVGGPGGKLACGSGANSPPAAPLFYVTSTHTLTAFANDGTNLCEWNTTAWQQRLPALPTQPAALVPDPLHRGFAILQTTPAQTWRWANGWQPLAPPPLASVARGRSVWDAARRESLVFVATGPTTYVTMTFDGTTWNTLDVAGPQVDGPLVYDPTSGDALLIDDSRIYRLGATDTAWSPSTLPTQFGLFSAAYDARNAHIDALWQTVGGTFLLESGATSWTEADLVPTGGTGLTADLRTGGLLMSVFGGAWAFAGDTWTRLPAAPETFQTFAVTYDPATGVMAMLVETQDLNTIIAVIDRRSATPLETCVDGEDADGDGLSGCDDPDCFWRCSTCVPYASCL